MQLKLEPVSPHQRETKRPTFLFKHSCGSGTYENEMTSFLTTHLTLFCRSTAGEHAALHPRLPPSSPSFSRDPHLPPLPSFAFIPPHLQSPAILPASFTLSPCRPCSPLQPWRPAGVSCPSPPWRGRRATCCWGGRVPPPCPLPSVPPCSSTGRLSSPW